MRVPALSLTERAAVAAGPLATLAGSLAADLDRFLPDDDFFIPAEKARLTRRGGRCERDGTFLEFDPGSPRRHRCPRCGTVFDDDEHYRWWIMGYQLWLSERAIHAAVLGRLAGANRHGRLAETIVARLSDVYLAWPNTDNVLGPTRPFFSTYLESIWLLQLSVAVMMLEHDASTTVGRAFRDRIVEPSIALIREFDEGLSNRQVWNSAAIGAAAVLLERPDDVDRALHGPGGLRDLLQLGLLSDGSWYEGENYHLFAHRGLWYLVELAERERADLPDDLRRRFAAGFSAPLRTALPDLTFPARRDAQYRASLRQWRIADSLELGLARSPDSAELASGLARLYQEGPAGDAQRWRSTGEAERNVPGVRLTRSDLGWKSLLFALPELPALEAVPPPSALMEGQGLGVMRRDAGRIYIALDYGHRGGSHGHPDRLNLWLVLGDKRIFEDVGTGSYVERTLHWYRSTLAHNAPLVDGRSQDPVSGSLRAWDENAGYAWIDAEAPIVPDVLVRRSIVVAPDYLIDRVAWTAGRDVTIDLPMHLDGQVEGAQWRPASLTGAGGLEDGFDFVDAAQTSEPRTPVRIVAADITGAVDVGAPHAWWRVVAPGPPGTASRPFLLVRATADAGEIVAVWSWTPGVEVERAGDRAIRIAAGGGSCLHRFGGDVWRVQRGTGELILDGRRAPIPSDPVRPPAAPAPVRIPRIRQRHPAIGALSSGADGLRLHLGAPNYRRTEATWAEAGRPEAMVVVAATRDELLVEVSVRSDAAFFEGPRAENPLDNEHPDVNSAGLQLHVAFPLEDGRRSAASWLLIPQPGSSTPRVTARDDAGRVPLTAEWRPIADGWQMLCRLSLSSLGAEFAMDVIVNDMPPGRERRRGQLVMSARSPGWAYLRGDRQDIDQLMPMTVVHD